MDTQIARLDSTMVLTMAEDDPANRQAVTVGYAVPMVFSNASRFTEAELLEQIEAAANEMGKHIAKLLMANVSIMMGAEDYDWTRDKG